MEQNRNELSIAENKAIAQCVFTGFVIGMSSGVSIVSLYMDSFGSKEGYIRHIQEAYWVPSPLSIVIACIFLSFNALFLTILFLFTRTKH